MPKYITYILLRLTLLLTVCQSFITTQAATTGTRAFGTAPTGRYAENSVLANGKWVKIQVEQNGIHKITYSQLTQMGFSNPENIRIYGYGGEMLPENFQSTYIDDLPQVSIYMEKGTDGRFSDGDFILFYAQGSTGWTYSTTDKNYTHTQNPYSFYGYYFLTCDKGASPDVPYKTRQTVTQDTITTYHDHYLHEIDKKNILSSGKVFFNEEFSLSTQKQTFTVNIPNTVRGGQGTFQIQAAHQAKNVQSINVNLGGTSIGKLTIPAIGSNSHLAVAHTALPFTQQSDNISLTLTYSTTASLAYLDYFIIETQRNLIKTNTQPLQFAHTDRIGQIGYFAYQISNTDQNLVIWDITNKTNIQALHSTTTDSKTTFVDRANTYKEYIAFNPATDRFPTPTVIGTIENQNLHASSQVDMVIISHADFLSEANRLAQAHADHDGLSVLVVDARKVYNEFSSGTPDATAYRRFMKMFYDRATTAQLAPKYLLLFGDGSFDNRQILKANTDKNIYRLLTYQSDNSYSEVSSYTTDDYFGFLDDREGSVLSTGIMDIAIGRIPAYTVEQAQNVVDKTIEYMQNEDLGAWKNQGIFLADDGDGNQHIEGADTVCNLTRQLYPSFLTRKLYFDSYNQESSASGESYPVLKKEFQDYINSGVLLINYMGHGGYNGWADERIFSIEEIKSMYNRRLPLWVTATCNFSRFDHYLESAGEQLLTHKNGGAIALVSTTRTVLTRQNNLINLEFTNEMFNKNDNGETNTVGRALMLAKNKRAQSSDANRLSYLLLGDPALRLNYPVTHEVIVDTINGYDITENIDTIGALSTATIKGYVADKQNEDREIDETFNGTVEVKVFDKMQTFTTLCNDNGSTPFTYTYRSNPLFSGKTTVTDGRFEIQFIIPKDIKYNFGTGKIILYASDPTQGLEGNGHCENIVIGGENSDVIWETDGPDIQMYLNTAKFANGDKVNENPLFVAHIADPSGINTIGTGFGHDIILKLDNDPQQEFILNSYYESAFGSFNEGYVRYQLTDLTPGKHTLYFRVWDMQNNSSSATLQFEVVEGLAPTVDNLYVYPNPVQDIANIVIENDRPSQPAEVYAYIYDFAGRMVWTNNGDYVADSDSRISIQWNINDTDSRVLNDGLYLVKIIMIDANGEKDKKSTKLILRRQ